MRRYLPACLALFLGYTLCAAEPSLKEARERMLRGNYQEAQALYEQLQKDAQNEPMASIGLSRVFERTGDYDKALSILEPALKARAKDPALLARRAEVLYLRGRWDEAEKAAESAIAAKDENFQARWVRAQIYRDRGDVKKADAEMRWFVRTYSDRSFNDNDIKDPEELVLVALAGCENARWHNLSDQFQFILDEVYTDAVKYDRSYWFAEYEAGVLLLEKYNRPEALAAFDKALAINPSAAEAYVGKGQAAMTRMEYKDAEEFAERALKVNPRLPAALHLRADIHLASGDIDSAMKELATARTINPRDERTLGRIAACFTLQKNQAEVEALTKEVEAFDSTPAVFFAEMGQCLEERRRFEEAEKLYQKAMTLRPMNPGPANSLGLLYMRMGREKDGKEVLTRAFEADPFNVRVSNMLKVIRHLEKYETIRTEHFEIRHDPETDRVLARYLGEYLEAIYEDLAVKFDYRPKGPILIEIFNNHEMFSGRTVALPDLHTIGACTGRIVTMVSPSGRGIRKGFNWGRVMRHELVHIFNLEQTNFLVPHWFTEGLAVENEGFARPQSWNELLRERVPAGKLMTLDNIDLGFMRPRNPLDWHMAYCQSQLYVQYIKKTYKEDAIGEMLAAFRDGLSTAGAIQRVCKVDKADFEKGYRAFLEAETKKIPGGESEKTRSLDELKAAHEKDPGDLDAAAELAEAIMGSDAVQARELAEKVRADKPGHPVACIVLARLARRAGDVKQERELLEKARENNKNPNRRVLLMLGKIYYDASEYEKAAEVLEQGRTAEPGNSEWLDLLGKVYAQQNAREKLVGVLRELIPTDADDLDRRKRLARLLAEDGNHAGAEQYAREALEIKVTDAEVHEILLKALRAQGKGDEAERMAKLLK